MNHRYGLCRVVKSKENALDEVLLHPVALALDRQYEKIKYCEPFIGELPTFLQH